MEAGPSGRRGGQQKYSDLAIETTLTLRLVFGLPIRQAEGFLRSLLSLLIVDLEAPRPTPTSAISSWKPSIPRGASPTVCGSRGARAGSPYLDRDSAKVSRDHRPSEVSG